MFKFYLLILYGFHITNAYNGVNEIKTVILQGGGAKGLSYLGVMKALEKVGYYNNSKYDIESIKGTSIGCLFSLIFSLDIPAEKAIEVIKLVDMSSELFDFPIHDLKPPTGSGWSFTYYLHLGKWLYKVFNSWNAENSPGLNLGKKYITFIEKRILPLSPYKNKLSNSFTFKELYEITGKGMSCYTSLLHKPKVFEYNHIKTPDAEVIKTVFLSGDLPFVFKPVINDINNCVSLDGGLYANFPMYLEENLDFKNDTLGFSLDNSKNYKDVDTECDKYIDYSSIDGMKYAKFNGFLSYIEDVANAYYNFKDMTNYITNDKLKNKIVFLNPIITTVSFDLKPEKIADVVRTSYDLTMEWFSKNEHLIRNGESDIIKSLYLNIKNDNSTGNGLTPLVSDKGYYISKNKYIPKEYINDTNRKYLLEKNSVLLEGVLKYKTPSSVVQTESKDDNEFFKYLSKLNITITINDKEFNLNNDMVKKSEKITIPPYVGDMWPIIY